MTTDLATQKQTVFDYVNAMLGGGMIDVELDPIHYNTALSKALSKFRQRSDNSVEESYLFMPTVEDENTYTLPNEVMEVRQIFRRSIGSRSGGGDGGTNFEPFNLAYTNSRPQHVGGQRRHSSPMRAPGVLHTDKCPGACGR